jgi:hypothetical protein
LRSPPSLDNHTCRAISIDANFNIPASRAPNLFPPQNSA